MKLEKFLMSWVILVLVLMTGCTAPGTPVNTEVAPEKPTNAVTEKPTEAPTPEDGGFQKSGLERELSPSVDPAQIDALAKDNSVFAMKFYQNIREQSGNLIYSPFSISLALSMALAGAEGETQAAMLDALQLSLPIEEVYPAYDALLLAIQASEAQTNEDVEGNPFKLNIANSTWGQAGFAFKESFLDTLAKYFGAGMYTVDYQHDPEAARQAINGWVAQETEDKIQNLIPQGAIDTMTRLVLANAIYFNGSWLYPFSEQRTAEAPFNLLDGSQSTVDMMSLTGEHLVYGSGDGYQVVQLPYLSSDFSMTILVPDQYRYEEFEMALTGDLMTMIEDSMSMEQVDLQMPKFDFATSVNANDPLNALGMGVAFDPQQADFSGMTDEDKLLITDVLHKATITVDESGTEAAAATAVIMGVTSAMPGEPISLVIDRPFLFFIEHQPTGSILFMGRVLQP